MKKKAGMLKTSRLKNAENKQAMLGTSTLLNAKDKCACMRSIFEDYIFLIGISCSR